MNDLDIEPIDLSFLKLDSQQNSLLKETNGDSEFILNEFDTNAEIKFRFDEKVLSCLEKVSRKFHAEFHLYSQAIFAALLCRYSGQNIFCIDRQEISKEGGKYIYEKINSITYQINELDNVLDIINKANDFLFSSLQSLDETNNKSLKKRNRKNAKSDCRNICSTNLSINKSALILKQDINSGSIDFTLTYQPQKFSTYLLKEFLNCYKRLFLDTLDELDRAENYKEISPIKSFSLLSSEQYQKIIYDWNQTDQNFPKDKTIHQLFEEQVEKTPNNLAVEFEETKLTYTELNQKANQLAVYLSEKYDIKSGDLVTVCLDRSEHMLITILAVLKAGGAYVPIDPSLPDDRIQYILSDTATRLVLSNEAHVERLEEVLKSISPNTDRADDIVSKVNPDQKENDLPVQILPIDRASIQDQLKSQENRNQNICCSSKDLAYVIYTSGTTGNPKGVMIEHQGIVNRIKWMNDKYPLNEEDKVLQKTPYIFDVSVWELFWANWYGACVVFAKPEEHRDAKAIMDLMNEKSITISHFVPSMLDAFLNMLSLNKDQLSTAKINPIPTLRYIFCSGEALPLAQVRECHKNLPQTEIHNLYGPTEASVDVLYYDCTNRDIEAVYIGKQVANTVAYVLDKNLMPMPIGAIGELYLGGVGLARGYLNKSDLTSEKFVLNPFQTDKEAKEDRNNRLYKTGDLVRLLPDGNIDYIGRNDFQVKIRGYRIELGEIESTISSYKDIRQSTVLVKDHRDNEGVSSSKYLVGYYVSEEKYDEECFHQYLNSKLPDYMVPTYLIHLKNLPTTINGKLDRKALPNPEFISEENCVAIEDELQQRVCQVWADILNISIDQIGIKDSFFRLGGNSILAMRLTGKLNNVFDIKLPITVIFRKPTVESLAKHISDYTESEREDHEIINKAVFVKEEEQVLSFAQERLWFVENFEQGTNTYNIPMVFNLQPGTRVEILEQSIRSVIDRHEILRTLIKQNSEHEIYQSVQNTQSHPVHIRKIKVDNREQLSQYIRKETNHIYNLCIECPIRIFFYELNSDINEKYKGNPEQQESYSKNYLSITVHHIAFDGWSADIFLKEIQQYYEYYISKAQGLPAELKLPELTIQYKDFSIWQKNYLSDEKVKEQFNYWQNKLASYETLNLITDKARPSKIEYTGRNSYFELDKDLSLALREVAKELQISLYSLLLGCYYLMLRVYTNQNDLVLGTPIANRHYSQTENLIGFFVNSLVLRAQINPFVLVKDFLKQVWSEVIEAHLYQDLPFEKLVKELKVPSDTSRHPIFQVMFGVQNFRVAAFGGSKESLDDNLSNILKAYTTEDGTSNAARFDLSTFIDDGQDCLKGSFNYAISLYNEETISRFIETYKIILGQISEILHNTKKQETLRISDLNYLNDEQRKQIIFDGNQTDKRYPTNKTIQKVFEEQVEKTPNDTALVVEGKKFTYQELNEKANRLAHRIKQIPGIKPESLVILCLDRNEHMLVSMLAILKAGCAYVPLDPSYPEDRIKYILSDTKSCLIITNTTYEERLNIITQSSNGAELSPPAERINMNQVNTLFIDSDAMQKQLSLQPRTNPKSNTGSTNLAYVIYTSGTTGIPKGVLVEHRGVINLVAAQGKEFGLTTRNHIKSCLWYSNYVFDAHVSEVYLSILNGHVLHMASKEAQNDLQLLSAYIEENKIDIATIPPALLNDKSILKLNTLVVAGDRTDERILNEYHTNGIKIINAYGPSETTVCATLNHYNGNGANNIGLPLNNTKCYILDDQLNPLPIGAVGELHIGGVGLARGYLNQPELTEKRFIPNPFQSEKEKTLQQNTRLYKTGDLVRWQEDGNIEYVGRNDFQVKLRGFRIELGEIENALLEYEGIKQSIVLIKEGTESSTNKYLSAYYVSDSQIDEKKIYHYLRSKLPDYMLPKHFIFLDKLPLNINGKIDRKALLKYTAKAVGESSIYSPPTQKYEKCIADFWAKWLGIKRISINDNFFDLGGHSLLLVKMFAALPETLQGKLKIIDVFKFPTVSSLSEYLRGNEIQANNQVVKNNTKDYSGIQEEIAIIGMSGRFPQANSIEEFWENLKSGKEGISFYTKDELRKAGIDKKLLDNPNYVRAQGYLDNIKEFDASFFGYTPREAEIMDPQHRIFLTCAWEALENAGYTAKDFEGNIGIYAGAGAPNYWTEHILPSESTSDVSGKYQINLNNLNDFLSTNVAYRLNTKGPAVNIQTACSTSLVAVHQACKALQVGDCHMALAGGVSLGGLEKQGYLFQPGMILSPDGKCRAFDADSQGTVVGQGAGIVILKPLSQAIADNDHIYAVIKASAINNDGHDKIGYTAPSPEQQAEVIRLAHEKAGISSDTVTYIETHGTGTYLGDLIEIEGLSQAFKSTADKTQRCAIGSVKTNIGHLDSAAGVTGLIKTALCLYHKNLVPSLHYKTPNPKINWSDNPFYVNTELKSWESSNSPRRAGVSSFGIGGTNAHVLLEESPSLSANEQLRPRQLLSLSAQTPEALNQQAKNLAIYLNNNPNSDLEKVAYTLHLGRDKFKYNTFVTATDCKEASASLSKVQMKIENYSKRPAIFMFPGQGSQYMNMGCKLYKNEPIFRETVDECVSIANNYLPDSISSLDILGRTAEINNTHITQVALFILEYSLARYLIFLGVKPYAMIGHSIGEYVAACLAEVFSLRDALAIVVMRGKLVQSLPGNGKMLAVSLPKQELESYLGQYKDMSIAAVNTVKNCVVSGPYSSIKRFQDELKANGIANKLLNASHAFHSQMLEPILKEFSSEISKIKLNKPNTPFISNLTGTWVDNKLAMTAEYWTDHLRSTVLFEQGLKCLFNHEGAENAVFIEVGPGQNLSNFVKLHPKKSQTNLVISSMARDDMQDDIALLLSAIGSLHAGGIDIDWKKFYGERNIGRIPLPTYPFDGKPYWIPSKKSKFLAEQEKANDVMKPPISIDLASPHSHPLNDTEMAIVRIWEKVLGIENIGTTEDFFNLGGTSLLALHLESSIQKELNVHLDLANVEQLTIKALANMIREQQVDDTCLSHSHLSSHSNVVMLKKGTPNKFLPLVLIHPVGGDIYFYRELAKELPNEQTVYAVRSPILGGRDAYTSIEEMAEDYLKELEKFGVKAPYTLCGASFGGIVAYHMAQILNDRGIDQPTIISIDAPAYGNMPKKMEGGSAILDYLTKYSLNELNISSKKLTSLKNLDDQIKYIEKKARCLDLDNPALKELNIDYIKAWQVNQNVMMQYVPSPYPGTMIFFSHTEIMPEFPTNQHLYWIKLIEGDFQCFRVPGNHLTMTREPNVHHIAQHMNKIICNTSNQSLN